MHQRISVYIQNKLAQGEKLHFFVVGASGYIGLVVTEFAIAQGFSVRSLSRSEASDEKLKALGATPVRGDLTTLDVLGCESAAADAVIHLAWNHDMSDYNKIIEVDTVAVNAMCASIQDTGKLLVITSGCGADKQNEDGSETDENAPPHMSTGAGGKGFLVMMMGQAVKLKDSYYINDGSPHTSVVHVEDAARPFITAALKGKAGEAFNAVGQTDVSSKDMAEAIGKVVGVPVRSVTPEEAAEKWTMPFLPMLNILDTRGSNKKAREVLGWKIEGVDYITDIVSGSYVPVAAHLKAQK